MNDQPVPVFFGTTPLFRTLDTAGTRGSDVANMPTALKNWQGKARQARGTITLPGA